jgi:hypothetical protein
MLEKLPRIVGHALRRARPGISHLVANEQALADIGDSIALTSPAFADGGDIPARYTADGQGRSPPLQWRGVPQWAKAIVLLVEDADSPTPHPLVHAIVWDLPGEDGSLAEGELPASADREDLPPMGLNSYLRAGWLPPDPPAGHGRHRYVFQIFALDNRPGFDTPPGRGRLVEAMRGHALAKGMLTGGYERA